MSDIPISTAAVVLAHIDDGYGHMGNWGGAAGWMWLWGAVMMALVIAGAIALIVWVARSGHQTARPAGMHRAKEILADRYARGEIDTAEFQERMKALE